MQAMIFPQNNTFPHLLKFMMDNTWFIEWSECGTYFTFDKQTILEGLKTIFNNITLPSFLRQLNYYGFKRINTVDGVYAYEHENFQRENCELQKITRVKKRNKTNSDESLKSADVSPNIVSRDNNSAVYRMECGMMQKKKPYSYTHLQIVDQDPVQVAIDIQATSKEKVALLSMEQYEFDFYNASNYAAFIDILQETKAIITETEMILFQNVFFYYYQNYIDVCMVPCFSLKDNYFYADLEIKIERKIRSILQCAKGYRDNTILVIGAWGCGKYENNPEMISKLFKKLLDEEYRGYYSNIVIAIKKSVDTEQVFEIFQKNLIGC